MSASAAAGFSRGLRVGLEDVRARRYREKQDAIAAEERARRHEREDFGFAEARKASGRADTEYGEEQEQYQHEVGRRSLLEARVDQGYQDTMDERKHMVERRKTVEGHQDTEWSEKQGEYDRVQKQLQQEGLRDFVHTLKSGGDPNYALQRFNRQGKFKIRPDSFQFDPKTGKMAFTDSDGDQFDGTIDQLGQTVGLAPDYIKLHKDEGVFKRDASGNLSEVVVNRAGQKSGAGDRKLATYNPETTQRDIGNLIAKNYSGNADIYGNWSVSDSNDRLKVNYLQGLAGDMEGRLREHVMSGDVSPAEISNAVLEAGKDLPTDSELDAQFRKTKLPAKQADAWKATEQRRIQADIQSKLASSEQKLLGKAARASSAAAKPKGGGTQDDPYLPGSQEEFDALDSGDFFTDPNGDIRQKP